ncbi:hypothetical protein [Kineothrix alysoides]|uniref:hypothetical protein n=1 Tax=Kineothrix alysoides TaxID=1469948 RepID=UPI0012FED2E3|nr:hypothetical protein [Kineothrix alysoides]
MYGTGGRYRPQMLLFSKGSLRDTICICMPYVVVAAGIISFNLRLWEVISRF